MSRTLDIGGLEQQQINRNNMAQGNAHPSSIGCLMMHTANYMAKWHPYRPACCTYSVAWAKGIPMNEGLNVSVYISIPVPRK